MLSDCPDKRKLSFTQEPDHEPGHNIGVGTLLLHSDLLGEPVCDELEIETNPNGSMPIISDPPRVKPELTCISEEGIADMDLPDNVLDDFEYLGDCITSCNKVN